MISLVTRDEVVNDTPEILKYKSKYCTSALAYARSSNLLPPPSMSFTAHEATYYIQVLSPRM
jgi:hypothetical protein